MPGRSPYGERGLKFAHVSAPQVQFASLSLRRAWIEIEMPLTIENNRGRSPYGERGLKFSQIADDLTGQVALLTESVD